MGFDGPSIHYCSGKALEALNGFVADIDTVIPFAHRPEVRILCGERKVYLLINVCMSKAGGEWAHGSDVMMNRRTPNLRYSNIMA